MRENNIAVPRFLTVIWLGPISGSFFGEGQNRSEMLALILGGAMMLVAAAQRGSLNSILNAIYQTGATAGGAASAWLYGVSDNFVANAVISCLLFAAFGALLWTVSRR